MNSFLKWNWSWLVPGKNTIRILTNTNRNVYWNTSWMTSRHIVTSARCDVRSVYTISLKTGKMVGAGTDANVYIRMIGELGSTEEMKLKTEVGHMERGMTDSYSVASDDVGVLKKLIVRHDNSGFGPAWFLEWVKVKDGRGTNYHFKCDEWLDKESSSTGPIKLLRETNYVNSDPLHVRKHAETIGSANVNDHLQLNKATKVVIKNMQVLSHSSDESDISVEEIQPASCESSEEAEYRTENINSDLPSSPSGTSDDAGNTEPGSSLPETDSAKEVHRSDKHAFSLSPAVRYILETYGIDMADVPGTGPYSRILKGDVLAYIAKENVTKKDFSQTQTPSPDINQVKDEPVFAMPQSLDELPVILSEHYMDRQLTEGYQTLADALKTGNFELPLMHMSTSCMVDKLLMFTETICDGTPLVTRNMVVSHILCQALIEAGDILASNDEEIDILLNHEGNIAVLRDCRYAGVGNLLSQFKSNKDSADLLSVPRYGLNIVDMEGVSQLSSVLRIGQVLCLNFGGTRLGINTEGKLTKCVTLSVSCDNRIITEETCATFLSVLKKYLSDPYLLQL